MCNIHVRNKSFNEFLSSCYLEKSHKLYATLSNTKYTKLFELVHTNLWGSIPSPSNIGYIYYITLMSACSRYTWVYLLKQNSDALSAFKLFQNYVDAQFHVKIKSVQSDFGGELWPLTRLPNEKGIIHMLTCPHASHYNVTFERKYTKIVEMGFTLLEHASMVTTYWDLILTTTDYLMNMLSTSALTVSMSPFSALYHK